MNVKMRSIKINLIITSKIEFEPKIKILNSQLELTMMLFLNRMILNQCDVVFMFD